MFKSESANLIPHSLDCDTRTVKLINLDKLARHSEHLSQCSLASQKPVTNSLRSETSNSNRTYVASFKPYHFRMFLEVSLLFNLTSLYGPYCEAPSVLFIVAKV